MSAHHSAVVNLRQPRLKIVRQAEVSTPSAARGSAAEGLSLVTVGGCAGGTDHYNLARAVDRAACLGIELRHALRWTQCRPRSTHPPRSGATRRPASTSSTPRTRSSTDGGTTRGAGQGVPRASRAISRDSDIPARGWHLLLPGGSG
jgi:hypothetical protein